MSVRVCGRDESSEQKGPNGGFVGVSVVRMSGGRPRGTSPSDHTIVEVVENSLPVEKNSKMNGFQKESGIERLKEEGEAQKRQPVDDDMLLQWGHRKRPRCSRPEHKLGTEQSIHLRNKSTRVDSHDVKAEKQVRKDHAAQRPYSPPLWDIGSSAGRRNVQESSQPLKDTSTGKRNCMSNDGKLKHFPPYITERPDTRASPLHRNSAVSACPLSTDNVELPDKLFETAAGDDVMKMVSIASHNVDLDSFEWPRIFISLSHKEKEDDFFAIKGRKLPQRPKRRPKVVEKTLHYCCPGNWLSDLARGRYDVREKKCAKKKPLGLKAMESSDNSSG